VKDKAQKVADAISADKAVAESKLEEAKPALQKAEAALQVCWKQFEFTQYTWLSTLLYSYITVFSHYEL